MIDDLSFRFIWIFFCRKVIYYFTLNLNKNDILNALGVSLGKKIPKIYCQFYVGIDGVEEVSINIH